MNTLEQDIENYNKQFEMMAKFIKFQCEQTGKTTDEFLELMNNHKTNNEIGDKSSLKLREELSKL